MQDQTPVPPSAGDRAAWPTRRGLLGSGAKLAFIPPILSTFFAHEAYAVSYSCYENGHQCVSAGDDEPCCNLLTCQADAGSPTGESCLP